MRELDCAQALADALVLQDWANARHVSEPIVAGCNAVREGRVVGIELDAMQDELLARLRAGMAGNVSLQAALADLERVLGRHFESEAACC